MGGRPDGFGADSEDTFDGAKHRDLVTQHHVDVPRPIRTGRARARKLGYKIHSGATAIMPDLGDADDSWSAALTESGTPGSLRANSAPPANWSKHDESRVHPRQATPDRGRRDTVPV